MTKKNEEVWKKLFGITVTQLTTVLSIKDKEYARAVGCSDSTLRRWKEGNRFASEYNLSRFAAYVKSIECNNCDLEYFFSTVSNEFRNRGYSITYSRWVSSAVADVDQAIRLLNYCVDAGKGNITALADEEIERNNKSMHYPSQNKTRAIVFDFDGTLTKSENPIAKTTWENIWTSLGYDVKECQNLHKRFDRKEIDHPQWCKLTEDKFKDRGLKKDILFSIADNIKLIDGVETTFSILREKDIKIFIVSGSIKLIIQTVLGPLNEYVDTIRANTFDFDENNLLTRIIGTKYDFKGKADYIRIIADELQIAPEDILFVGNSRNDQFAHESGARTLCINPRLTDMTNTTIWNECIETCDNLEEILDYI